MFAGETNGALTQEFQLAKHLLLLSLLQPQLLSTAATYVGSVPNSLLKRWMTRLNSGQCDPMAAQEPMGTTATITIGRSLSTP